jgi:hypothetical protein
MLNLISYNMKAPVPPILPEIFSTRMEINSNGKQSTDLELNFDYNRRKASLVAQSNNLETRLIFDYENDEIHVIECIS